MEFLINAVGEYAKGLMGELGKASARAIIGRGEHKNVAPEQGAEEAHPDPLAEAQQVAETFWNCLSAGDHHAALSWCDPEWLDDPRRSQNLHDALEAAPAMNWSTRQCHVPSDWIDGNWLEWVVLEMIITFDLGDGSFSTLPLLVSMIPADEGWQVADIDWDAASEPEPELNLDFLVQCERCPNHLAIPAGSGPYRIKCPECWTPQTIDRDALA